MEKKSQTEEKVRTLLSDENRVAASVSLHDRMYFEQWKTNQLHLRIWFWQSDCIVRDSEIEVFRSEDGFILTIDNGTIGERYDRIECRVAMDSSTDLYNMMINSISLLQR